MLVPSVSMAATLHAIIVADTNASDIGASARVDVGRMGKFMRTVSENTGLRLNLQKITGNDLTPNKVRNAVNRISSSSNDVVFFYWTGHGYNRGNSVLPTMHIDANNDSLNVDLKEIANTLRRKNPRLFIVIGDTCNKPLNVSRRDISLVIRSSENYKKLFLQHRGEVLASGSKVGGYSYGGKDKGGFYTTAFLNSFTIELAVSGIPSWKDLMKRADKPIEVYPGIIQQPISNTNKVSYMGTTTTDEGDCQEARHRPDGTCNARQVPRIDTPTSGGCTDPSNQACW